AGAWHWLSWCQDHMDASRFIDEARGHSADRRMSLRREECLENLTQIDRISGSPWHSHKDVGGVRRRLTHTEPTEHARCQASARKLLLPRRTSGDHVRAMDTCQGCRSQGGCC